MSTYTLPRGVERGIDVFWYWILERERIRLRRLAGNPWPWTDDRILQTYRFCNVFREQDTVTQWIRRHWRAPLHTLQNPMVITAMALARLVNWPPTLVAIESYSSFPTRFWPTSIGNAMREHARNGAKVYTGAYMLRGPDAGGSKIDYTVGIVTRVHAQITQHWRKPTTIQGMTEALTTVDGLGGFLAYEIATDLRHTFTVNPVDADTYAHAGPGAVRGLNRIHGRPVRTRVHQTDALGEMRELLEHSRTALPKEFPRLELRDIEHSLCELDKYLRVYHGEGAPRAKYVPPTGASA